MGKEIRDQINENDTLNLAQMIVGLYIYII